MIQNQIHFVSFAVAVEEPVWALGSVIVVFEDFAHAPRFKDCSTQGVTFKLFWTPNTKQVTQQTRVIEVQLRRFDESFANIAVKRSQAKSDETGLQKRKPTLRCSVCDPTICPKRRQIEKLPNSSSTQLEKGLESQQIPNIDQLPDVSFHIRRTVAGQPFFWRKIVIVNSRITARPYNRKNFRRWLRETAQLIKSKRQQIEQNSAAGQSLRDSLQQPQML